MLYSYLVRFVESHQRKGWHDPRIFVCKAENAEHAREQLLEALPTVQVQDVWVLELNLTPSED